MQNILIKQGGAVLDARAQHVVKPEKPPGNIEAGPKTPVRKLWFETAPGTIWLRIDGGRTQIISHNYDHTVLITTGHANEYRKACY